MEARTTNPSNPTKHNLTLNAEQLRRLNNSYAQAGVKWLAMFGGLWAEVAEVKNGLLVLSITWPKHAVQTGYRHERAGLLLRILFRCRASSDYDLLNGLRRVYILSSIDNSGGKAGFIVREDELSEAEMAEKIAETKEFGTDTSLDWDEVIEREEVLEMV